MRERALPVTVITGFLGAGKTTLLRQLCEAPHGQRLALIVNELGQAGIDAAPSAELAYLELTEGCACCVRNPDLIVALDQMCARDDITRIVIETSGLADPLPLTWTIERPEFYERLRLDAVVTVVDVCNFAVVEASEEWRSQVRSADIVILSKLDLVEEAAARAATAAVHTLNPSVRLIEAGSPRLAALLLDAGETDPLAPATRRAPHALSLPPEPAQHSSFGAVTFSGAERYLAPALEDLLDALPAEVFRAKGIVPLAEGGWASFHVVGQRVQVDLEAPPPPHGEGRLVFFGRDLDPGAIGALLAPCRTRDAT